MFTLSGSQVTPGRVSYSGVQAERVRPATDDHTTGAYSPLPADGSQHLGKQSLQLVLGPSLVQQDQRRTRRSARASLRVGYGGAAGVNPTAVLDAVQPADPLGRHLRIGCELHPELVPVRACEPDVDSVGEIVLAIWFRSGTAQAVTANRTSPHLSQLRSAERCVPPCLQRKMAQRLHSPKRMVSLRNVPMAPCLRRHCRSLSAIPSWRAHAGASEPSRGRSPPPVLRQRIDPTQRHSSDQPL